MRALVRKCKICDNGYNVKSINLDIDKYIFYKNSYYHYNCFLNNILKNNKKELSENEIKIYVDKLVLKTQESKTVRDSIDRDRLTYWIYENYNVTTLPNLFFTKLTRINNGTYDSSITAPISYNDLLQIFKKMKSYLDKTYSQNERKGKTFTTHGRINYDLAIVLNNYDDYLKWKQKQKAKNTETKELMDEIKSKSIMQTNNIVDVQRSNNNNDENTEVSISDMLDELF